MIEFDSTKCWCDQHIQPFLIYWPKGFVVATIALFHEAIKHPDVIKYCGGGEMKKADADKLTAAMMEFSPLCCLIGDERTSYWTNLALTSTPEQFKEKFDKFRES